MKKFSWLLTALAGLLLLTGSFLVACGDDDDDTEETESEENKDPGDVCVDEYMRLLGPDGCLHPGTNTEDQIEQACSNADAKAGSTECGQKAFEELADCLEAVECEDTDIGDAEYNACAENFETKLVDCA